MTDLATLKTLTERELQRIIDDFMQPDEVRDAAKALRRKAYLAELRAAVADFKAATPLFVQLTGDLMQFAATIKGQPAGGALTALARVTDLLDKAGDTYRVVAGLPDERTSSATENEAEATSADAEEPVMALAEAPAPPLEGSVRASTKLSEIAGEYEAMFEAAAIPAEKAAAVDRTCEMALASKARYDAAVAGTRIPWWFVAAIHSLESSFNFARHLHNGDTLNRRTMHVPANRPESGNPPFTWEESALDAMQLKRFDQRTDWSLPYALYRLECYNGLGYRRKGLPTPYLWSFTDRYRRGKYVADGRFDAHTVSKQVGAAATLKHLRDNGHIDI